MHELEYFASKGLWHLRPREEAYLLMGKAPRSVKWVDTNKQDDENPLIRSRLVAREICLPGQEGIFAPTPPLEALRTVLSMATTCRACQSTTGVRSPRIGHRLA